MQVKHGPGSLRISNIFLQGGENRSRDMPSSFLLKKGGGGNNVEFTINNAITKVMISRFSDASDKIRLIKSVREELVDSEILNLFEVDLSDISRIYVGPDIWEGKRDKWESSLEI